MEEKTARQQEQTLTQEKLGSVSPSSGSVKDAGGTDDEESEVVQFSALLCSS